MNSITDDNIEEIIYIRKQGYTIIEAINRQLAHYPYHIGQIIFICKMLTDSAWLSVSIPRSESQTYNVDKFSREKDRFHYTNEFLK